jgi:hypothetical protein
MKLRALVAQQADMSIQQLDCCDEAYLMPTKDDKWIAVPYILVRLNKA